MMRSRSFPAMLALAALAALWLAAWGQPCSAQGPPVITVEVDAAAGRRPISPYLYGKNGLFDDDGTAAVAGEAGLRMARESHGNNCTKYNWREDLSSHPDWYNNVYKQGLHERARRLSEEFPEIQGLFGFQVLGWVARTDEANFREQEVDPRPPARDNLCGGGDPDLYLMPWGPADTAGILDYWFGPGGLGLRPESFRYWHLDNEPECWASTHDDVADGSMTPEQCIQLYVGVALEVKRQRPDLRLLAPGFTSEWMWWNWNNEFVDGMPWAEYFVKRMAEESARVGVRLVDVIDYHTYIGGEAPAEQILEEHRVFYDPSYEFPRGNGCKRYPDGGWHEDQRVERIFGRTEEWIAKYFGPDSGVTIGITEAGSRGRGATVDALWYASMLGTFADHGVEVFTPWDWAQSWWEVMYLFSRRGGDTRVESRCSGEPLVSAYSSVAAAGGKLTVILVNRDPVEGRTAEVRLTGFAPSAGPHETLLLSNLPEGNQRTFVSGTDNALVAGQVEAAGGALTVTLPPYSVMAVLVEGQEGR